MASHNRNVFLVHMKYKTDVSDCQAILQQTVIHASILFKRTFASSSKNSYVGNINTRENFSGPGSNVLPITSVYISKARTQSRKARKFRLAMYPAAAETSGLQ